jgi:hypothetical protein
MKKTMIAIALSTVLASGCAGFEFYTDAAMEGKQTGMKFYTPKPYVLVGRVGGTGKPVEVSIVYLPDMSQPYYARARSGWGSSNLTMKLADGRITEFGQQVDTGGAATLSSIATLATALGAKSAERGKAPNEKLEFSLYEIDNSGKRTKLREVKMP